MQIRTFLNADKEVVAEFIRTTYSKERKRGVSTRLGRFVVRVITDIRTTAVWRKFTQAEQEEATKWWKRRDDALAATAKKAAETARARVVADAAATLERTVSAITAALKKGDLSPDAAVPMWTDVAGLTKALKQAKVAKPPKQVKTKPFHSVSGNGNPKRVGGWIDEGAENQICMPLDTDAGISVPWNESL